MAIMVKRLNMMYNWNGRITVCSFFYFHRHMADRRGISIHKKVEAGQRGALLENFGGLIEYKDIGVI